MKYETETKNVLNYLPVENQIYKNRFLLKIYGYYIKCSTPYSTNFMMILIHTTLMCKVVNIHLTKVGVGVLFSIHYILTDAWSVHMKKEALLLVSLLHRLSYQ